APPRPVPLGGDELEPRLRVDEPANEPSARDAIDVDPLPGHPRGTAGRLGGMSWCRDSSVRRAEPHLEPRDLFGRGLAARGPERGRTYTEFLMATAPRRCNLRHTFTRK